MHQLNNQSANQTMSSFFMKTKKYLPLTLALMILPLGYSGPIEAANTDKFTGVDKAVLMEQHYNAAISGHDALIRGDLKVLRSQLARIAAQELPATAPESWRPHHARLNAVANGATSVTSLDSAAFVMSAIAEACGACHSTLGVGKIYFWPAPPDDKGDKLKTAMKTHQWATERLWEGITGPFNEAWNRGAVALAEARIFSEKGNKATSTLLSYETTLREVGQEAKQATEPNIRAIIYGRLLSSCAKCHQESGVPIKPIKSTPPWQQ